MMEKEIKVCPFCGHKVKLYKGIINKTNTMICSNQECGADVMFFGSDQNEKEFIKKWNRRIK